MYKSHNIYSGKARQKKILVSQARPHQFLAAGPFFFLIKWVW